MNSCPFFIAGISHKDCVKLHQFPLQNSNIQGVNIVWQREKMEQSPSLVICLHIFQTFAESVSEEVKTQREVPAAFREAMCAKPSNTNTEVKKIGSIAFPATIRLRLIFPLR